MKSTRRGSDSPVHRREKTPRFQIPLDKWPVSPGTPRDSRSPFLTSGLRFGTPAITTRGVKEDKMDYIVELIDRVLHDPENEENIAAVRKDVNAMMAEYPLFAW